MLVSEIVVIGDSVFKGVVFDTTRQRYALLKDGVAQLLSALLKVPLVNRSQMGRTAPEALAWLREQPAESLCGRAVVLEFGGNDCDLNWKAVAERPDEPHEPRTPVAQFTDALSRMVRFVRECGGRPLLSTLPPLDAVRYLNWITRDGLSRENILRYLGQPERIYRWQEYYSALVTAVAASLSCELLPVREAFLSRVRGEDVLCVDGIHPNALGHRIMADAAYEFAINAMALDKTCARA